MALPKRSHSSGRRDRRRSHWKPKAASMSTCSQCTKTIRPHHACPHCGFYRGRQVVKVAVKEASGSGR